MGGVTARVGTLEDDHPGERGEQGVGPGRHPHGGAIGELPTYRRRGDDDRRCAGGGHGQLSGFAQDGSAGAHGNQRQDRDQVASAPLFSALAIAHDPAPVAGSTVKGCENTFGFVRSVWYSLMSRTHWWVWLHRGSVSFASPSVTLGSW